MFFERHPILSMGWLAASTLTLLADVTDPFTAACLLTVGVVSSGAFGLGLASLLESRSSAQPEDADRLEPMITVDPPALPPPDGPDALFADRIRHERDSAPARHR